MSMSRDYIEEDVICPKCRKKYHLVMMEQVTGFKEKEEEVCPYCFEVKRKSMTWDFITSKIFSDNIVKEV